MKTIEIQKVGPIQNFELNVPEEGGVVLLRGRCGSGKTHALAAINALSDADARKKLSVTDGADHGMIKGLGVTVRLGRRTTALGELEVESIDAGVDPSVLVDPGIKDPQAADSKRLETVVRLAGITIPQEKWIETVGEFGELIVVNDLVVDDPVKTSDKIRRALHNVALSREKKADSYLSEAAALKKSVKDIDLKAPCDAKKLQSEYDEAYQTLAALNAAKTAREKSMQAVKIADQEIQRINSESGVDILLLEREIEAKSSAREIAEGELVRFRRLVEQKELEFDTLGKEIESLRASLATERNRQQKIESLRKTVSVAIPDEVDEDAIGDAQLYVNKAADRIKNAEVVRRGKETWDRAVKSEASGLEEQAIAEKMRVRARSMDAVLEESLIKSGFDMIRVSDGRLCVHSDRGMEPVSELSTGERWRLAFDIAAKGLGRNAILSIQQEGWQSLDPEKRVEVAQMAKDRGLLVFAAQVDSGELRSEVL